MLAQVTANEPRNARLNTCFLLCALVIILMPFTLYGQDKIHKTDNSVIEAKVLEINKSEIKYKKFSNQNGPSYIIPVTDVAMIVYENGEKEVFYQSRSDKSSSAKTSSSSVASNPSHSNARNFILTENIKEAISAYGILIKTDDTNPVLLAEDAYALALAGVYDAALMRLDICRSSSNNSLDINYFTSQVFALMGYNDLASEFWRPSLENKAPDWISAKAPLLLKKYRSKSLGTKTRSKEQLIANFKRANELASQTQYFQSIALFQDIINIYPNEYLPYVGYSITLEKTGALEKSAQSIEKAISLIGNTSEDQLNKQYLQKRLASIKQNMAILPPYTAPEMPVIRMPDAKSPQMMAYAGGLVAPNSTNINGRIGYFISGTSNASLDFGVWKAAEYSASNVGLTVYNRQKSFVTGGGILLNSANGTSAFSFKFSVGFSKMNKKRNSSFDIFLDMNKAFKKDGLTTFCYSIGTSKYFGKRK